MQNWRQIDDQSNYIVVRLRKKRLISTTHGKYYLSPVSQLHGPKNVAHCEPGSFDGARAQREHVIWKNRSCYGYLINCVFCSKSEMVWYFIGVYIINRTVHGHLELQNFRARVEKYFSCLQCSLVKYFSTLYKKFCITAQSFNILYIST